MLLCENCGRQVMKKMRVLDKSQSIKHWDLWKEEKHSELGKRDELTARLSKERDIPASETEEILGMLIREGKIFEPRPGYLKKT